MEPSKTLSKWILCILAFSLVLFFFLTAESWCERPGKKFTPVTSFSDDRQVPILNDNFKRLGNFIIDKTSFSVTPGYTISTFTFVAPQLNSDYAVFVQTTWDARLRVLQKTTTGFAAYHLPPGVDDTMDVMVVR